VVVVGVGGGGGASAAAAAAGPALGGLGEVVKLLLGAFTISLARYLGTC
jgi:hypothetical protein